MSGAADRTDPPLWQRHDDVIQVRIPVPFPLKWVNSYLVKGSGGYTLIDPGLRADLCERAWERVLAELGIRWTDVSQVVITHFHPDHYGLAGEVQRLAGCPVIISRESHRVAMRLWGPEHDLNQAVVELFVRHGMDRSHIDALESHLEQQFAMVLPHPEVTYIEPGERLRIGGIDALAVSTPGHAAGHLSFYDPERRRIFCGDFVLMRISPNIGYIPGVNEDPLGTYLDHLRQAETFRVDIAFPGHREPFAAYAERARELVRHHERRLAEMRALLAAPKTAYELCRDVFGDRLTVHQFRFAMAETLAHVIHLERKGSVIAEDREGVTYFRQK